MKNMGILKLALVLSIVPMVLGFKALQSNKSLSPKLDPFLVHVLEQNGEGPALVIMKEQADLNFVKQSPVQFGEAAKQRRGKMVYKTLTELAQRTQADLADWLEQNNVDHQQFYIVNAVYVKSATIETYNEIAERDDVEQILPNPSTGMDRPIKAPRESMVVGIEGSLVSIGVDRVWTELGVNGAGIVVSGQDTGIDWDHKALKNQYRGVSVTAKGEVLVNHNYNWHDAIHSGSSQGNPCGYDLDKPCDDNNHGTHSLGTVVGSDGGDNLIGVAPGAKWIGCRNMDSGNGTPATYIECFQFFLAPYPHGGDPMQDGRPELAPHVMNNSWGCPPSEGCYGDELVPALRALDAAGIFVVASAGNEGPSCGTINDPPAWHSDLTFSVGAVDHRNSSLAFFSSKGPSRFDGSVGPDIVAPGVGIRSAVDGGGYEGGWSGTSMAGPHVAGVVALVWSANPDLIGDIEGTADLLRETATPKTTILTCGNESPTDIPNNSFGYGIVNAFEAVKAAQNPLGKKQK